MKLADYVIDFLGSNGIDKIFTVYGSANGDLVDAFTRTDKTEYVAVMHEQGGGFAAEGYAKISGKYGVAIATSGPGGMNFVTPIGNCFYDCCPLGTTSNFSRGPRNFSKKTSSVSSIRY